MKKAKSKSYDPRITSGITFLSFVSSNEIKQEDYKILIEGYKKAHNEKDIEADMKTVPFQSIN